ncbi:transcriptional regulator [Clostridium sp. MCC353]|uniref:RrF2 family transcriptional regulator n=1 Tax=Clostridium sp. MCC353 TaxID=2592646 RepID=UPI001C031FFE|nr:Rrf2 family transcriptional regulator [Clostridium sp. MCC353]MBT9777427.1 transcriptional regulator [Clostridium sp. MCC353]
MTSEFGVAVHALVFLNHKAETVSSEVLADNICTNPARVRKIMAKLKKAGLLATKEGLEGGYLFDKKAADVSLCMVADALETEFVSASWKSGDPNKDCMVASGMAGVLDELYGNLDQMCRDRLTHVTVADLDKKIFKDKNKEKKEK